MMNNDYMASFIIMLEYRPATLGTLYNRAPVYSSHPTV